MFLYVLVVEQGEITWDEEEEFEVEQILDRAEEDVS